MIRLLILASSLLKLFIAVFVLGYALWTGWHLAGDRQPLDRVPVIMTVLLATFPLVGFVLYYKFWEEKPPLSSACLVQAILGTCSIVIFQIVAHYTPLMPAW